MIALAKFIVEIIIIII